MLETLIGGALGGIFRTVPEILKFFDAKNERKHELSMQDKALEFQKMKGDQQIEEITEQGKQDWNKGALSALETAIKSQGEKSGIKLFDAFSSMMRPLITFQWVIVIYPAVIIAKFWFLFTASGGSFDAVTVYNCMSQVFGGEEKALVAGILNFWFLGRVFDKVK